MLNSSSLDSIDPIAFSLDICDLKSYLRCCLDHCLSSLFLKVFKDGADTTLSGGCSMSVACRPPSNF